MESPVSWKIECTCGDEIVRESLRNALKAYERHHTAHAAPNVEIAGIYMLHWVKVA